VDDPTVVARDDFANWLTPQQALLHARSVLGYEPEKPIRELLIGGIIKTVALKTSTASPPNAEPHITEVPEPIPARYWGHLTDSTMSEFWQTGIARFYFSPERKRVTYATIVRCFDVRLHPTDVETSFPMSRKIVPARPPARETSTSPSPTPASPNKGGRPPKFWWQDFWVEMCCRIYEGEIQPTATQAAILAQMQQWVSDHDYEAGDTVLKEAAQKPSRALKSRSET
jgi:hypothetical protein